MKQVIIVAIVFLAISAFSIQNNQLAAQQAGVNQGLNFGYGWGVGRGFTRDGFVDDGFHGFHRFHPRFNNFNGVFIRERVERPPHFALFPPVYYSSEIVRRPMGVSPFAAPPGIVPVEMMGAATSARISNPYFKEKAVPVNDKANKNDGSKDDTKT